MTAHQAQWNQLQNALSNHRLPQAMLFVGPLHCDLNGFVSELMQFMNCEKKNNQPCKECLDCRMVSSAQHPDVEWIKPDKNGGSIKIDQIRELQQTAYLTPQRSAHKIIVIEAADRMNTAAANALLKILEEPAQHAVFILISQQLSTVLPTILSRCQLFRFNSSDETFTHHLLQLGRLYPQESDRARIVGDSEAILDGLIAVVEGRQHPCFQVPLWAEYELCTLLWFFYLIFAQLLYMKSGQNDLKGLACTQLNRLSALLTPLLIFTQIDKINTLSRKISHNMNVNPTLVLEDLLLGMVSQAY